MVQTIIKRIITQDTEGSFLKLFEFTSNLVEEGDEDEAGREENSGGKHFRMTKAPFAKRECNEYTSTHPFTKRKSFCKVANALLYFAT